MRILMVITRVIMRVKLVIMKIMIVIIVVIVRFKVDTPIFVTMKK